MDVEGRIRDRIGLFRLLDFRVVVVKEGRVVIRVKHSPLMEREGGMLFGGL